MACETDFTSDSDEGFKTKISDDHLVALKDKIIQCLTDSKDMSAEIQHEQGKPATLFVTLGPGQNTGSFSCYDYLCIQF